MEESADQFRSLRQLGATGCQGTHQAYLEDVAWRSLSDLSAGSQADETEEAQGRQQTLQWEAQCQNSSPICACADFLRLAHMAPRFQGSGWRNLITWQSHQIPTIRSISCIRYDVRPTNYLATFPNISPSRLWTTFKTISTIGAEHFSPPQYPNLQARSQTIVSNCHLS